MVSLRCKLLVKEELQKLGLMVVDMELGFVEIAQRLTLSQHAQLKKNLLLHGLEVLDDKKSILVEKIKNLIIDLVHHPTGTRKKNYSDYLSEKMEYDYNYLSNIFTEVKGITIQQFIILNKIEKVKELLLYDELNLTEIAYRLDYSSSAHLTNQFKKITGLSPSFFKHLRKKRRENLENL
jgi:AraC-like DNA-binding protein